MSDQYRRMGNSTGMKHYQLLLQQNIVRNTIELANRVTPIDLDRIEDEDTREYYREALLLSMDGGNSITIRTHYDTLHRDLDKKLEEAKAINAEYETTL